MIATKDFKVHAPFTISINSGSVVGPSAGLAYALEMIDVLTPGELTGGKAVAATGELASLSGEVGEIGGVAQKTVTVQRAGAEVFLVPRANYAEAKAHAREGPHGDPDRHHRRRAASTGQPRGQQCAHVRPARPEAGA